MGTDWHWLAGSSSAWEIKNPDPFFLLFLFAFGIIISPVEIDFTRTLWRTPRATEETQLIHLNWICNRHLLRRKQNLLDILESNQLFSYKVTWRSAMRLHRHLRRLISWWSCGYTYPTSTQRVITSHSQVKSKYKLWTAICEWRDIYHCWYHSFIPTICPNSITKCISPGGYKK